MFSEQERQIYTCPITGRAYDPLSVRRAIITASKNQFNSIVGRVRSKDKLESETAIGEVIAIGRKALTLEPVSTKGDGILDSQVYDAITAFTVYLTKKGLRERKRPTSAPCTDCPG
jgi:hypothetical protein